MVALGRLIDEYKGGFFVNAYTMDEFAFKAAFFNQPSRANFNTVIAATDGQAFVLSDFGIGFCEIDVFKERAGAGFFSGVGEFFGPNDGNDITNTSGTGVGEIVLFEVTLDRLVEGAWHLSDVEFESDGNNKIAAVFGGI